MMNLEPVVSFLQLFRPECILIIEYIVCSLAVVMMAKVFGKTGLMTYVTLAVIIANIQVLKAANFSLFPFPIALGTIVFSSTFIAVDILNEFYGEKVARAAVWMSFASVVILLVLMICTLGIQPARDDHQSYIHVHQAISILFLPAPQILAASLCSFLVSQYIEIWIFQLIRRVTHAKWIWLRTSVASLISALIDNALFSVLAWVIFAPNPISLQQLLFTYILGTYTFRVIIILLQTPLMYCVRTFMKRNHYASL